MNPTDEGGYSLTRRRFLGSAAGLVAGRRAVSLATAPSTLSVMTRNLYVGTALSALFDADSMDDVRRIAGRIFDDVEHHPYAARLGAIASEVAATTPTVVAVQEAAVIRTQRPGDFGEDPDVDALDVHVDLLDTFLSELAARGLTYEVAAETITTDVELPADVDGQHVDVRLTDRDVLLVHSSGEASDPRSGTFETALTIPMDDTEVSIERGYCSVDVGVDDADVTVATTHLESTFVYPRQQQARELLDRLPPDRPVVLAGDFNSGPDSTAHAYELLMGSFDDAYSTLHPESDGYTCCQAADLRNDSSRHSRRIDAVLYRGGLRPVAVERVGADPADRVRIDVAGEARRLWPSDHAGVVATFEVPGATRTTGTAETRPVSSTRTVTPTPTKTSSERGLQRDLELFRFGFVAGAAALVVAALARRSGDE